MILRRKRLYFRWSYVLRRETGLQVPSVDAFDANSNSNSNQLTWPLLLPFQFNLSSAQIERNKTKEQLEEEKKISLSFRIKPLVLDNMSVDKLQLKAADLWEQIVKLETEKYDLEERQKRQDYDVSWWDKITKDR